MNYRQDVYEISASLQKGDRHENKQFSNNKWFKISFSRYKKIVIKEEENFEAGPIL